MKLAATGCKHTKCFKGIVLPKKQWTLLFEFLNNLQTSQTCTGRNQALRAMHPPGEETAHLLQMNPETRTHQNLWGHGASSHENNAPNNSSQGAKSGSDQGTSFTL